MTSYQRMKRMLSTGQEIGADLRTDLDLAKLIRSGIAVGVVDHLLAEKIVSLAELHNIVINARTLRHRKARRQPLTEAESDRLLRLVRIVALAEETFANKEKAASWLRRHSHTLGGEKPIDLLDTDAGSRSVEAVLHRIGHGLAA